MAASEEVSSPVLQSEKSKENRARAPRARTSRGPHSWKASSTACCAAWAPRLRGGAKWGRGMAAGAVSALALLPQYETRRGAGCAFLLEWGSAPLGWGAEADVERFGDAEEAADAAAALLVLSARRQRARQKTDQH